MESSHGQHVLLSQYSFSGTDNDFDRSLRDGVFLYRYPGTSYLATIALSLRDKIHSSPEALLKRLWAEALGTTPTTKSP